MVKREKNRLKCYFERETIGKFNMEGTRLLISTKKKLINSAMLYLADILKRNLCKDVFTLS